MPILGADLPANLIEKTRTSLISGILSSQFIRELVGEDLVELKLTRRVYTGDYVLRARTLGDGFFPVAKFGMLPMAGCKGVVIFHHVETEPRFRNKGLGKELLKIRQTAAKEAGYSIALATVVDTNTTEQNLLNGQGWIRLSQFQNSRTRNWVSLYQKVL